MLFGHLGQLGQRGWRVVCGVGWFGVGACGYNMIQFKEVVFVRLRKDNSRTNTNYDSTQYKQKVDETRGLIRKFISWSEYIERHDIKEVFMNYENKAIYSNGIIIREIDSNHFEVELLTTVPRPSLATRATLYENQKNYVNYNSEFTLFHSNPYHLFDSLGYKIVSVSPRSWARTRTGRWSTSSPTPSGWK